MSRMSECWLCSVMRFRQLVGRALGPSRRDKALTLLVVVSTSMLKDLSKRYHITVRYMEGHGFGPLVMCRVSKTSAELASSYRSRGGSSGQARNTSLHTIP